MLSNSLKKNISKKINILEPTFANIVYSQKMLIMLYDCTRKLYWQGINKIN